MKTSCRPRFGATSIPRSYRDVKPAVQDLAVQDLAVQDLAVQDLAVQDLARRPTRGLTGWPGRCDSSLRAIADWRARKDWPGPWRGPRRASFWRGHSRRAACRRSPDR